MEKGDQLTACAIERFFVNQFHARAGSLAKLAFDIIRCRKQYDGCRQKDFSQEIWQ